MTRGPGTGPGPMGPGPNGPGSHMGPGPIWARVPKRARVLYGPGSHMGPAYMGPAHMGVPHMGNPHMGELHMGLESHKMCPELSGIMQNI